MTNSEKKPVTIELVKFVVYIVSIVISFMLFYGAVDKRLTIVETEMLHKVDDRKLFEKLDQLKEDLSKKIESEIQKVKK
jgi:hypothetical protein